MKKAIFVGCFLMMLCFQVKAAYYEIVTASNDPDHNALIVYSADGEIVQEITTGGKGGVPPHSTGGGIAKMNDLVAVINHNSQSVSLFQRQQGIFRLVHTVPTLSPPVSLAFGNDHLYILGTTTIESHFLRGSSLEQQPDGSSKLLVGDGTAAQVGLLGNQLIVSERSNMIELVDLNNGVVGNKITPVTLPPPPGNNTPVGLTTRGNTAYVTIAHSDKVGVVQNGKLDKVISTESQHVPCWLSLMGAWLFSTNTPSKSISRFNVTDNSIAIAELIAAKTNSEPTDIDAGAGILAVLELDNGGAYVSQFQVDSKGNLTLIDHFSTTSTANGIAVIEIMGGRPQNEG